jgi:hypothetical protein
MGLKINAQIGTIDGITSEAYVRITNYSISKNGFADFRIEAFMKKEDSASQEPHYPGMPNGRTTQCAKIGTELRVSLMADIVKIIQIERPVLREITYTNGNGETVTETKEVLEMVDETVNVSVADLSQLEDVSIFTFAYGKLKEKLKETFGGDKVVDA